MRTQIQLTTKQAEYIRNATHRWNIASGAVRSGKSHVAIQYVIPHGILARADKKGINLILGATRENLERNVLGPLREVWGNDLVSDINSKNDASICRQKVYCIGAENARQVSKIRGSEIKFCYCDELVDINEDVFNMLKSRLSLPYSECHAACNPAAPTHYVKRFIDSAADGVDVYCLNWQIYDNPFLPEDYVHALETEYANTVYFDRYILGKWTLAEGLIYPNFADAVLEASRVPSVGSFSEYVLSIDYGTQNATAGLLWGLRDGTWYAFREYRYSGRDTGRQKTDADYVDDMLQLVDDLPISPEGRVTAIIDPSAASFIAAMRRTGKFKVLKADNDVLEGIRQTAVALQQGKVKISKDCTGTIRESQGYAWDTSREDIERPIKIEDHCMDALRYFVKTKRLVKPVNTYRSVMGG